MASRQSSRTLGSRRESSRLGDETRSAVAADHEPSSWQAIPDGTDAIPSNQFDSPAEEVAFKRQRRNAFGTDDHGLELAGDRVEPVAVPSEGAMPNRQPSR